MVQVDSVQSTGIPVVILICFEHADREQAAVVIIHCYRRQTHFGRHEHKHHLPPVIPVLDLEHVGENKHRTRVAHSQPEDI